jgi:hypothetical protein
LVCDNSGVGQSREGKEPIKNILKPALCVFAALFFAFLVPKSLSLAREQDSAIRSYGLVLFALVFFVLGQLAVLYALILILG